MRSQNEPIFVLPVVNTSRFKSDSVYCKFLNFNLLPVYTEIQYIILHQIIHINCIVKLYLRIKNYLWSLRGWVVFSYEPCLVSKYTESKLGSRGCYNLNLLVDAERRNNKLLCAKIVPIYLNNSNIIHTVINSLNYIISHSHSFKNYTSWIMVDLLL